MKLFINFIVLLLLTITSLMAQSKIGVINTEEIISKSIRGQGIQRDLKGMQERFENELKTVQDQARALQQELQNTALGNDVREQKSRTLTQLQEQLQRRYEDMQRELNKMRDVKLKELEQILGPIITDFGKTEGYSVILKSENVVFANEAIDLTDQIITRLNASR